MRSNLLLWAFLSVFAFCCLICLSPIVFVVSLGSLWKRANWRTWAKRTSDWLRGSAVILDIAMNTLFRHVLNPLMLRPIEYGVCEARWAFGQWENRTTISFVIAMNLQMGSLSQFGILVARFLEWVDPGHLQGALDKYKEDVLNQWREDLKKDRLS